jgi:hypothetical protein
VAPAVRNVKLICEHVDPLCISILSMSKAFIEHTVRDCRLVGREAIICSRNTVKRMGIWYTVFMCLLLMCYIQYLHFPVVGNVPTFYFVSAFCFRSALVVRVIILKLR